MSFFGGAPRQVGNYNQPGNNDGYYGHYPNGDGFEEPRERHGVTGVFIALAGTVMLGGVMYFAPKTLVWSFFLIMTNLIYLRSKEKLLYRHQYPSIPMRIFAFVLPAVTLYFVIQLMFYPHPFWTNLLALYGILSLIVDMFYKVFFQRYRDEGYDRADLLGMELTSNQFFFINGFHVAGHFALITFYVATVLAIVRG